MKKICFFATIILFNIWPAMPLLAQAPAQPVNPTPAKRVALWSDKAPVGNGTFEDCNLELEVFLPPVDKASGAAIVLCPGGVWVNVADTPKVTKNSHQNSIGV